jgi:hypothetical protein
MIVNDRGGNNQFPDNQDDAQLALPLDVRAKREVHWVMGTQEWLANKVVTKILMREDLYLPRLASMDSDHLSTLTDAAMRYAMRFADAAAAVGWTQDGPYSSFSHGVSVTATDEGIHSRLIDASYTGTGSGADDIFLQNLHSVAPDNA